MAEDADLVSINAIRERFQREKLSVTTDIETTLKNGGDSLTLELTVRWDEGKRGERLSTNSLDIRFHFASDDDSEEIVGTETIWAELVQKCTVDEAAQWFHIPTDAKVWYLDEDDQD